MLGLMKSRHSNLVINEGIPRVISSLSASRDNNATSLWTSSIRRPLHTSNQGWFNEAHSVWYFWSIVVILYGERTEENPENAWPTLTDP